MNKFSVREWLFIIVILMLLQFLISSNSYTFSNDQTLLNYISFASTIASILLAIIAIIYGFIQSDSTSKTSYKILDSLKEFRKISNKIVKSTDKSDKQLDRLQSITDVLTDLKNSINQSSEKLLSVEQKMIELQEVNNDVKNTIHSLKHLELIEKSEEIRDKGATPARKILRKTTVLSDIVTYALYKASLKNDKIEITELVAKYIFELSNEDKNRSKPIGILSQASLASITFNLIKTLQAFDIIDLVEDGEDQNIIFNEAFKSELSVFAEEIKESKSKIVKEAVYIFDQE